MENQTSISALDNSRTHAAKLTLALGHRLHWRSTYLGAAIVLVAEVIPPGVYTHTGRGIPAYPTGYSIWGNNPTLAKVIIVWYNYVVVMCIVRAAQSVVKIPQ